MVVGSGQGLVGQAEDRGFSGGETLSTLQCEKITQLLGGDGPGVGGVWSRSPGSSAEVHPAIGNLPVTISPGCVSRQGSWDVNQETCQRAWQMMVSQEIPALPPSFSPDTELEPTAGVPQPHLLEPQKAKLPL